MSNKVAIIVDLDDPLPEGALETFGHKMFNYFSPDASSVTVALVLPLALPAGVSGATYTVERVV